ncbi:hypothetical protein [Neptuniibacter marinus]|uniref:hypothetical protein n=1 Tax=Neptuniibacter marinus TaxID=1806670 RepID=UPI003B5A3B19
MIPSQEQEKWIYKHMLISRFFEETIETIYMEEKPPVNMANHSLPSGIRFSNDQKSCAVDVCTLLNADDIVTSTVQLDCEALIEPVKKEGRLIVVDEDYHSDGMSGEIIAIVVDAGVPLKAAPQRVITQFRLPRQWNSGRFQAQKKLSKLLTK